MKFWTSKQTFMTFSLHAVISKCQSHSASERQTWGQHVWMSCWQLTLSFLCLLSECLSVQQFNRLRINRWVRPWRQISADTLSETVLCGQTNAERSRQTEISDSVTVSPASFSISNSWISGKHLCQYWRNSLRCHVRWMSMQTNKQKQLNKKS